VHDPVAMGEKKPAADLNDEMNDTLDWQSAVSSDNLILPSIPRFGLDFRSDKLGSHQPVKAEFYHQVKQTENK
jgi:hypothetical protein